MREIKSRNSTMSEVLSSVSSISGFSNQKSRHSFRSDIRSQMREKDDKIREL